MNYVLAIDQSTQGTKALLLDETGATVCRADRAHRQLVSENGWVSHDPEEIYENVLLVIEDVVANAQIDVADILCMGISNQRETTVVWDRSTGKPVCDAIVWQCSRAAEICDRVLAAGYGDMIRMRTGIPASPYFPAAKLAWILEHIPDIQGKPLCFGTMDTWLIWKLTGAYKTDYSNASRTQLFNLSTLAWDADICRIFGLDPRKLPEVCDSDSVFGYTDLRGLLKKKIPVCAVLGDSHAALFGQGCFRPGMTKATYGTGSSVMMNIGTQMAISQNGLVTSLAWKAGGVVNYVLEGNINYTGAVITWLKEDMQLIASPTETAELAEQANPADTTYFVPAFTGLGAPYWNSDARAMLSGITRLTGKKEIVRAALDCIAYQITDVVRAMEADTGLTLAELRTDGGATWNHYLMGFQSDILGVNVAVAEEEALSAIGVGYLAGISAGLWDLPHLPEKKRRVYIPKMHPETAKNRYNGWHQAVKLVLK